MMVRFSLSTTSSCHLAWLIATWLGCVGTEAQPTQLDTVLAMKQVTLEIPTLFTSFALVPSSGLCSLQFSMWVKHVVTLILQLSPLSSPSMTPLALVNSSDPNFSFEDLQLWKFQLVLFLPCQLWALMRCHPDHYCDNLQLVQDSLSQLNIQLPILPEPNDTQVGRCNYELRQRIRWHHGLLFTNLYECTLNLEVAKACYQTLHQPNCLPLGPGHLPLSCGLLGGLCQFSKLTNFSTPLHKDWDQLMSNLPQNQLECEKWADDLWDLLYLAIHQGLN